MKMRSASSVSEEELAGRLHRSQETRHQLLDETAEDDRAAERDDQQHERQHEKQAVERQQRFALIAGATAHAT